MTAGESNHCRCRFQSDDDDQGIDPGIIRSHNQLIELISLQGNH